MISTSEKCDGQLSSTIPDWSLENDKLFSWHPSKSLIKSIRTYQKHTNRNNLFSFFIRKLSVAKHIFWSAITGADIPINCTIGGGVRLPHPNGVVIHPGAIIGPNCLIFQQVTIGAIDGEVPVIAGHVDIGAGAKILGNVKIGPHSRIGANAVVLIDVPAAHIAVGVPATTKPITYHKTGIPSR